MKLTMKLLVVFFEVLLLANVANAETPCQQLQQMVEQLQRSPNDDALRERIHPMQCALNFARITLNWRANV